MSDETRRLLLLLLELAEQRRQRMRRARLRYFARRGHRTYVRRNPGRHTCHR